MNNKVRGKLTLGKQGMINLKLTLAFLPFGIMTYLYSYRAAWGLLYGFVEYRARHSIWECDFLGLQFFRQYFINDIVVSGLLKALRNTLFMNFIGYLTSWLAMFITVMMNEIKSKKYLKAIQILTTIPNFVSWIIIYSAFYQLMAPSNGLLTQWLNQLGLLDGAWDVLISADKGYALQFFLTNWKGLGWGTIVYFAALGAIDDQLYEAAAIDGAGRFRKMWHVTIPGLLPTYITLLVMSMGGILGSNFEFAFVFKNAKNAETLHNLSTYIYEMGMGSGKWNEATAFGLMTSVIGLVMLLISNKLSKKIRGASIF